LQKDHAAVEGLLGSEKATSSELLASLLGAQLAEAIEKSETTEQKLASQLEKTKKLEWDRLAEEALVASLENQLENASEAASSSQKEIQTCRDTISGLEAELEKAETSRQALKDQLQKEASLQTVLQDELSKKWALQQQLSKQLGEERVLAQERDSVLQLQFSDASRRVLAADEDQAVAQARHQELEKENQEHLETQEALVLRLDQERALHAAREASLHQALAEKSREAEAVKAKNEQAKVRLEEVDSWLQEVIVSKKQVLKDATKDMGILQDSLKILKHKIRRLEDENRQVIEERDSLQGAKEEMLAKLKSLEVKSIQGDPKVELQELKQNLSDLENQKSRLVQETKDVCQERDSFRETIKRNAVVLRSFQLHLGGAQKEFQNYREAMRGNNDELLQTNEQQARTITDLELRLDQARQVERKAEH
jgi:chromosome segregation ATPase